MHNIWVDSDSRVMVCDRENDRIQMFNDDGEYLEEWTDLEKPADIWVHDGVVFVAELGPGGGLSIWTPDGTLITRWRGREGDGKGTMSSPHGLCVDLDGSIYLTEIGDARRVQKFQRV